MTPIFTPKIIGLLAGVCVLGIMGGVQEVKAVSMEFSALLTAGQEVNPPGSTSTATGKAKLFLNESMTELSYEVKLNNLDLDGLQTLDLNDDVMAFHFHNAPAGSNGSVVFGQISPAHDDDLVVNAGAGTLSGIWSDADAASGAIPLSDLLGELKASNLYFNAHTPEFPPGAIRGQIRPVPEPSTLFLLGSGLVGLTVWRWKQSKGRNKDYRV